MELNSSELSRKILSDITVYAKYAKYIPNLKRRETWEDIVMRNVQMHIKKYPELEKEIWEAYSYVLNKQVVPSMRSMQFAGKPIDISPNRIFNCSFLAIDDYRAFGEAMFLLLGGTGFGYSIQKHHVDKLPEIFKPTKERRYLVGDSIEGWADAVKALISAYMCGKSLPKFDFRDIRPKGARLITSGGVAPGYVPLSDCLHNIKKILAQKENGSKLTTLECHDILCYIADAVLAGGIRRAAMIALFSFDDEDMLTCKYGSWYELNPQRARANNSVVILRHRIHEDEFKILWNKIQLSRSGEPGIFFTNNKELGINPCSEISLRSAQMCNLTEVNVSDVTTQEDLNARCRAAAFIGTLQAGYTDFHYLRDVWKRNCDKDALLGVSLTGICSGSIFNLNIKEAAGICVDENKRVAKLIGIKSASRVTCIKPSGTTSLVLSCSSGIHEWHARYYIRRLRLGKNEALYKYLINVCPDMLEDDVLKPNQMAILSVPQKSPNTAILRNESTSIDLLERVKKFSNEWIVPGHITGDNKHNVSVTVSVKDDEYDKVGQWLWKNKDCYTGITILPFDGGSYAQMPYEECSEEKYNEMIKKIKDIDLTQVIEDDDLTNLSEQSACSGSGCSVTNV